MKWRYIEVNYRIPQARFIDIQFEDFSVKGYREDWREVYEPFVRSEQWEVGETGCRYWKWRED